ncbi:MFS transporter [Pusillimonas sp. ANT_WB101]|uniref:MFS transporter n=1 Tax=Pusillimonas sp. ANT_WB101 TaxID=2597356 RepID=UPI0011EFFE0D|nr:MFS transporter [Pusillimonas sp. ANT_WB101]KAA0890754.1 MFS transporter [Pusillimonas sp. ANT_WB101]
MKHYESSWSELLQGRNGLRSLALAGGVAVHAVNVYIVTTILPSVVEDIGGLAYYAWNMTLFVVASIIGSALSPKTMDSMGLRHAFLFAIFAFSLGTIVCAMAPTMPWLLAGRTAQGLGGGLLLGLSYSAVRLVFEERLWSRAMVLVSSMWGVATLAGPAIGGIFAQTGHWRLAFWAVLPIAGLLAVLVHTQLQPRSRTEMQRAQAPFRRIMLLALSVLVVSIASVPESLAWNSAGVAAGVLLTLWIARLDKRAAIPLLPRGTYASGTALASLYACIALLSMGVTTEVYIPYFLQIIHGKTPLVADYWMALLSAGWTAGSFVSSGRSTRVVNMLIRMGPVVSALSLALLAVLMPLGVLSEGGSGLVNILMLPLFGVGLGVGICWPNLLTRVFRSAPKGQENIASAGITTLQLYAMAMGAALAGMVANAAGLTSPGGVSGTQHAALALFAVFACAPGLAIFMTGGARAVADRRGATPSGKTATSP